MKESFPNNEDRRSFRVLRRLSRPSRQSLIGMAECTDVFPRHDIRVKPVGTAALTLVGKGLIMNGRSKSETMREILFPDLAKGLLEPELKTARHPHRFKVVGLGEYGRIRMGRDMYATSLALTLDDPRGILEEEHYTYTQRLGEVGGYRVPLKTYEPHVTIAQVDPTCATSDLLAWLEQRAPEEIMLLPVTTDPRPPRV